LVNFAENYEEMFLPNKLVMGTIATSNPPPKARPSMAATDGFLAAEKLSEQI